MVSPESKIHKLTEQLSEKFRNSVENPLEERYFFSLCVNRKDISRVVLIEERAVFVADNRADTVVTLTVSRGEELLAFRLCLICGIGEHRYAARIIVIGDVNIHLAGILEVGVAEKKTSLRIALCLCGIDDGKIVGINNLEISGPEAVALYSEVKPAVIDKRR